MADLATLIAAIPTASDGAVITPDYHNKLLDALKAIASQLGPQVGDTVTHAFSPTLLNTRAAQWRVVEGAAFQTTTDSGLSDVHGWMPTPLPDGSRIQSVTLFGSIDTQQTLRVALHRLTLSGPGGDGDLVLCETNITGTQPKFVSNLTLNVAPSSPDLIVDNKKYQYTIFALAKGTASPSKLMEITGFQIVTKRS